MTLIRSGETVPISHEPKDIEHRLRVVDTIVLHEVLIDPDAVSPAKWSQQSRLLLQAFADWYGQAEEKEALWARLGVLPERGSVAAKQLLENTSESKVLFHLAKLLFEYGDALTSVEVRNATTLFVLGSPDQDAPNPLTAFEVQRQYGASYYSGLQASHYIAAGLASLYDTALTHPGSMS